MSQDDQEALAAQWAAQLEDEADNADADGGGAAAADAEAADDKSAARPPLDDDALAAQWAEALAEDEEDKGPTAFGGAGSGSGGGTFSSPTTGRPVQGHDRDVPATP